MVLFVYAMEIPPRKTISALGPYEASRTGVVMSASVGAEVDVLWSRRHVSYRPLGDVHRALGLLTIFLKQDETRPLAELNAQLERQGFYKAFPPAGVEVVSWNIVMG